MALLSPRAAALLGVIALAVTPWIGACFDPKQPSCAFSCVDDGLCPSGYSCGADGICHRDDGAGVCDIPSLTDGAADADAGLSDLASD
jgi:hypothetical protein